MSVFIGNLALLGIWGLLFHGQLDPRNGGSKLLVVVISAQLFLFVAMSPLVSDALNYETYARSHTYGNAEIGWVYFSELVWALYPEGKSLVLATNLVISIAFGMYVWRNSRNIVFSYFIYICLGLWGITFFILRQTIAMAILLFAFEFLKRKSLVPFLVCTFAASLFHQTALIFLLLYPISLLERNKRYYIIGVGVCLVEFAFGPQIVNWLLSVFRNGEVYAITEVAGLGYFAMLVGFATFACLADRDPKDSLAYRAVEVSVVLQVVAFYLSIFVRAVQYFSIHLSTMLPSALLSIGNTRVRFLLQMALVVFFVIDYVVIQNCAYPEGPSSWYMDWSW